MTFSFTTWWQAIRPKTLPAALVPVLLGCLIAWRETGQLSTVLAIGTLLSVLLIQIATNLFNDAIDFEKGADTINRLGPKRVTASGLLTKRQVMCAAGISCLAAALCAIPLIEARGPIIILIGLFSLALTYSYTGGPFPLAYLGLGELFVVLFFGLLAVAGTAFVQCGEWLLCALIAGVQIGILSATLLAINNLRDIDEDSQSNKNTLAVRLGAEWARKEITFLFLFPHVFGTLWISQKAPQALLYPLITLPLAITLIYKLTKNSQGYQMNRYLGLSALHLLLFALFLGLGLAS